MPNIITGIDQGSSEWLALRLGVCTASRFKDVMTDPRAKKDKEAGIMSDTAKAYLAELAGEKMTGIGEPFFVTKAMEWGINQEPNARAEYEFQTETECQEVTMVMSDCGRIGYSPDSLVGNDGCIEIKCPMTKNHIKTIMMDEMPDYHAAQVQGGLWVADREWMDFASYDPRLQPHSSYIFIKRYYRDEEYIKTLSGRVTDFCDQLSELLEKLK